MLDQDGFIPSRRLIVASAALLLAAISLAAQPPDDSAALRKLLADASGVGLPAGASAPPFNLKDQSGHLQNLASLAGPKGLILVFFRSADW